MSYLRRTRTTASPVPVHGASVQTTIQYSSGFSEGTMDLRHAWAELVTVDDYDAHMAAVGQASANAELVATLLRHWPPAGAQLLVAGAGTGQMLEYIAPSAIAPYSTTFADINQSFLERLSERASARGLTSWRVVVDDIEDSQLGRAYDGVIVVLVLEHVDAEKALDSIARLCRHRVFVIIQQNPEGQSSALTPASDPVGTMAVFRTIQPTLVSPAALTSGLENRGFRLAGRVDRPVANGKTMCGFVFEVVGAR